MCVCEESPSVHCVGGGGGMPVCERQHSSSAPASYRDIKASEMTEIDERKNKPAERMQYRAMLGEKDRKKEGSRFMGLAGLQNNG